MVAHLWALVKSSYVPGHQCRLLRIGNPRDTIPIRPATNQVLFPQITRGYLVDIVQENEYLGFQDAI